MPNAVQQPFGQVVASQEQVPLVVSHSPFVHLVHMLPVLPHSFADSEPSGMQVVPLQQPPGHDVASQTQEPATHSWPVPHPTHAAPLVPHSLLDGVMQTLPLQQPLAHEVASHTHCPVVVLHS